MTQTMLMLKLTMLLPSLKLHNIMLEDGYIQEAIEATSWADSIARFYQKNANVKHRIKKLLKKTRDMSEKIEKEWK
jgi:lipid A disaccharide synthetase